MSLETATTIRPRGVRLLLLGLVATMLVAGCGSAGDAPAGEPRRESVTKQGPQLVRVHYTQPLDTESESYGVEMDVIARGADQSHTKMDLLVEDGRVDETVLIIRDGNRALLYDPEAKTPSYTLMEAADEHPEDLALESSPLEPASDDFQEACPDADPTGTRTILGRGAVGYACTWEDPDPYWKPEKIWLDKATGMILENGRIKATEFVVDPEVDESTFSTKPPAGADVDVVEATGKGPPPPEGQGEPSSEDALATIASTSPIPIYYLGPEFEGETLSDVAIFDDTAGSEVEGDLSIDAGQSLTIWYGDDFQMSTTWLVPGKYRNAAGCSRLQPLRGVPTVEQADAVSLFSGDLVIWLGVGDPKQAVPAAAALVEVGNEPTGADLPAPPARNVVLIDKACGAKPGDTGPALPD